MEKAFKAVEGKYLVPEQDILLSFKELKENNFINEWVHVRKRDRSKKIISELICSLTISEFNLRLRVLQNDQEIFNQKILTTDPDEIAFGYRFKSIEIKEKELIVTSKTSDDLFVYQL